MSDYFSYDDVLKTGSILLILSEGKFGCWGSCHRTFSTDKAGDTLIDYFSHSFSILHRE